MFWGNAARTTAKAAPWSAFPRLRVTRKDRLVQHLGECAARIKGPQRPTQRSPGREETQAIPGIVFQTPSRWRERNDHGEAVSL